VVIFFSCSSCSRCWQVYNWRPDTFPQWSGWWSNYPKIWERS